MELVLSSNNAVAEQSKKIHSMLFSSSISKIDSVVFSENIAKLIVAIKNDLNAVDQQFLYGDYYPIVKVFLESNNK